ncbi:hypothetical protein PN36_22930 [Candidatus Thiomargarita nelsonii]|uniref:Uncharacterized protein n=1 Tax=Candidatus Thiomargarita nelsonii TaxID=1003181 RepID=A0A0A6SAQ7_9GAMM|nr:hypothetical protein PN36_22930 [Candidatus Thiomargarita nelsonii]
MYFFLEMVKLGGGFSSNFDMAIGLARHQRSGSPALLENFAQHVYAKTYADIYGNWWPGTMERLKANLFRAMNDARYLKVNLDGLIESLDEFPILLQKGSRGIEPVEVINGVEILQIGKFGKFTQLNA